MSKKEDTQEWENEYDQVSFLSKSQNPAIAPIWFDTQNNPQCGDPPIFEYKYSQFVIFSLSSMLSDSAEKPNDFALSDWELSESSVEVQNVDRKICIKNKFNELRPSAGYTACTHASNSRIPKMLNASRKFQQNSFVKGKWSSTGFVSIFIRFLLTATPQLSERGNHLIWVYFNGNTDGTFYDVRLTCIFSEAH